MRRTFAWAAAGVSVILAVTLLVVLITRGDEAPKDSSATSGSSGPAVTSPYDFTEADSQVDFDRLDDAKFISLSLETPTGLKSYLLAHDSAGFAILIAGLTGAREIAVPTHVPGQTTQSVTAGAGEEAIGSSLTVVMPDRTTYTFALDLEGDALVRGARAWRLQGGLRTLVESVTAE